MNRKNSEETKSRIVNLDFLRGLFIILALDQHFTYYINMWYVEFFRDSIALTSTYKVHFAMIGKAIATDRFNMLLDFVFTPWVSQVYLTLATFNLARKPLEEFRLELPGKLKIFALIFVFFVIENFIVAPNLGQAISFYPIMLWMIIMSILAISYSTMGIVAVWLLALLSLTRFVLPVEALSDFFQNFMINNVHPGFEYDARIEYFFLSGCLGFIMGHAHYHCPKIKKAKDIYFLVAGILFVLFYFFMGDPYIADASDVFSHEHDLARSFSGTLYILGVQSIVISGFLWLEEKNIKLKWPVFTWVGVNSIFVFAIHRIFFVRFLAPLSNLIGTWTGRPLGASVFELYTYVGITLAFCYFIKKSRMGDLILQRK